MIVYHGLRIIAIILFGFAVFGEANLKSVVEVGCAIFVLITALAMEEHK